MKLQAELDKFLKENQRPTEYGVHKDTWSPSQMGKCFRAMMWYRAGVEPSNPIDVRTLRVFKAGDLFHEFIQQFYPLASEIEVKTEDILGRADIVLGDIVIDLKSQHSMAFWHMNQKGYNLNVRKRPAILQLMVYVWALGKKYGKLVFISKDDLCIEEFDFKLEDWRGDLQAELDLMRWHWEQYIEHKELPKAEPRAYIDKYGKPAECKYCNYRDDCKALKKKEKLEKEENDGCECNTGKKSVTKG